MKRSHLTPDLRTDKNGVSSVRWVNPDAPAASSSSTIPAPAPLVLPESVSKAREALITSLASSIYETESDTMALFSEEERISYDELAEKLSAYETRTLQIISDKMPGREAGSFMPNMFVDVEVTEPEVRAIMTFRECFDRTGHPSVQEVSAFTLGLRSYDLFSGDEELSELTGQRMEQARALCKVGQMVEYLSRGAEGFVTPVPAHSIMDKELVRVVLDNPHRASDIARLMKERKTTDAAFIGSYLADGTPLATGIL